MRTISSWLLHLLWRAQRLPAPEPSDGLVVGLSLDGRHDDDAATRVDFWMEASTVDDCARILDLLARLGTVDQVVVLGAADLPIGPRRELGRLARRQRVLGIVVEFLDA